MGAKDAAYLLSEVGGEREAERLRKQADLALEQELPVLLYGLPEKGVFHDLGCGTGRLAAAVARARADARVLASDLDQGAVEAAAREAQSLPNLTVIRAAVDQPLLGSPPADTACLRLVLMHLKDPVKALRQARAWLKPGGHLHVIEGDDRSIQASPALEWLPELLDVMEGVQQGFGGSRRRGRDLAKLLSEAGYSIVSERCSAPDPALAAKALGTVFVPVAEFYLRQAVESGLASPEKARWLLDQLQHGTGSLTGVEMPLFHVIAAA